ncbi:hypothetical protein ID866_6117 [Astraeus odoratus]|nr:hypothetical protein ID866_6117 [Astraeus odoratus]
MSDPVAAKSAFLCMYMKSHPDTLVAYVKYFGKVGGNVVNAEMSSIDTKGMSLSYKLESGGNGQVHVPFQPPLAGYDEVKPRLLSMKADAQEGLGMIKTPQLTTFEVPVSIAPWMTYLLSVYVTCYPPPGTPLQLPFTSFQIPASITDVVFAPARISADMLGFRPTLKTIAMITLGIHAVEALYVWSLCRRYVRGRCVTATHIMATFLFGFPVWMDIHRRVKQKRIESVMKVE